MAKRLLDDQDDDSPESVQSLIDNDSESEPTDADVVNAASTPLDPDMQSLSDQLTAARPSDSAPATDNSDDDSTPDAPTPSKADQLRDMMAKATGRTPVQARMNTGDAIAALLGNRTQQLSSAQNLSNNLSYLANMSRAGETIGNALAPLAHRQADNEGYQAKLAQAQAPVQQALQQQDQENKGLKDASMMNQIQTALQAEDPNSDKSKLSRMLLKYNAAKAGMKDLPIPENLSASDADKFNQIIATEANRQAMVDMKKAMYQTSAINKQNVRDAATDKSDEAVASHFENNINPAKASSRSPMGRSQLVVDQAKRIEQLLNQYDDKNGMPKNQVAEVATALNAMLSNGTPSVAGTHMLVPSSLVGDLNGMTAYLTNHLTGAGQASFVNNMRDTIGREKNTSSGIVQSYQQQLADAESNAPWAQRKPERYNKIVKSLINQDRSPASQSQSSQVVRVLNPKTGQIHSMSSEDAKLAVSKGGGQIVQ